MISKKSSQGNHVNATAANGQRSLQPPAWKTDYRFEDGSMRILKEWIGKDVLIWASARENLSSGVCEQHRRRPACASAQSDQRLCYSQFGNYRI